MASSRGDHRPAPHSGGSGVVGVVGHCSSPGCRRPAVCYVERRSPVSGRTVAGVVCAGCARATEAAAFLLDLIA